MLHKIITILLFSCIAGKVYSQAPNCYLFKEGKFRINDARAGGVIVAERRAGYQTESMEVLKAVVRFKISWENDCSYTLTLDKVIRNENKIPFPPDMHIEVKIISSSNNSSYIQEANSSVTNGSYRSEVLKIP
jgi:hypothetical protein